MPDDRIRQDLDLDTLLQERELLLRQIKQSQETIERSQELLKRMDELLADAGRKVKK